MKVSIPTRDEKCLDGLVEQHFGKAPYFLFVEIEEGKI